MKFAIMLMLVIGLATADFLTGIIKAFVTSSIKSYKMRQGGVKKLGEIIVTLSAIGCDIGITQLIKYYPEAKTLGDILSNYTSLIVTSYIIIMEIVSILENFAAIYPEANWAQKISKKLATLEDKKENTNEKV